MNAQLVNLWLKNVDDEAQRAALIAMDEDAVDPLISAFYAGVNEAQGVAILELVGEIGGPDALTLLRNVGYDPTTKAAWRTTARGGLLMNWSNLSPEEVEQLLTDSN